MVSIALDVTFFIQMGLFLALVYILNILVYRPVLRVMGERATRISTMEGDAEKAESGMEESLAKYRKTLDEARARGTEARIAIKKTGTEKETEILGAAHEEANGKVEKARIEIAEEKKKALKSLKQMIDEMGQEIAGKTLGRAL